MVRFVRKIRKSVLLIRKAVRASSPTLRRTVVSALLPNPKIEAAARPHSRPNAIYRRRPAQASGFEFFRCENPRAVVAGDHDVNGEPLIS